MTISNDKDWILENLVEYVNGTDRELGITIAVEGILISGTLVSGHRFVDEISKKIILDQPLTKAIKDMQNKQIGMRLEFISENYVKQKDIMDGATFLHLFNAKFHRGKAKDLSYIKGVAWRGMLDKVSGFYLND